MDLLKVNIEGGEYDLFDRLLAEGLQTRCRCILEWDYAFVWESWLLRDPSSARAARTPRD